MMNKSLFALPFLAAALIAAKPAPPPAKPVVTLTTPAEVAADPANRWTLNLSNGGHVVIQLRPDVAPGTVYRIQQLTAQGFYNGLTFHRVIPGFMAQGGDPKGTGEGGSPLPDLAPEFNDLPHLRGVASMARAEQPNSANSQFFIMLAPRFTLDHKYSAFGRVIEGMSAVDQIAVGEPPAEPTRIVSATIGGPLPAPPVLAAAPEPAPAPVVAAAPTSEATPAAVAEPAPEAAPAPTAAEPVPEAATAPAPADDELHAQATAEVEADAAAAATAVEGATKNDEPVSAPEQPSQEASTPQ
jgi:peptidylprolyl isomerase